MKRRNLLLIFSLSTVLAAGCGSGDADEPASSLSRAERDSILADSPLPGSAAVQGALDVADTAAVRSQRLDDLDGN